MASASSTLCLALGQGRQVCTNIIQRGRFNIVLRANVHFANGKWAGNCVAQLYFNLDGRCHFYLVWLIMCCPAAFTSGSISQPRWLSGLRRCLVHSLMIARRSLCPEKLGSNPGQGSKGINFSGWHCLDMSVTVTKRRYTPTNQLLVPGLSAWDNEERCAEMMNCQIIFPCSSSL